MKRKRDSDGKHTIRLDLAETNTLINAANLCEDIAFMGATGEKEAVAAQKALDKLGLAMTPKDTPKATAQAPPPKGSLLDETA